MNKCSKCGTEFEGKFCPECGTKADDNATKNAAPATQAQPAAPTTRPAQQSAPAAKPARHIPWFMWRVVKGLDIAAVVMLPLFSVLVLFFLIGSTVNSPLLGMTGISAYAAMREGGKAGGMMVALLVFAIIGIIIGAAAVFMLVRKSYGFAAMIATLAINFVICLVDIIVCARFGKLVDETYLGLAETGSAIRLTLGFGITFMILSLLVLAGRIAIAFLFPSVKEETATRPRRERNSSDIFTVAAKFIAVAEWIMVIAPVAFAVLTLILAAFPVASIDKEAYGVSSVGNCYTIFEAQMIPIVVTPFLVPGIILLAMRIKGHKTTLGFAILSLCIPTVSYIFFAVMAFMLSENIGDEFVVTGFSHIGVGITLLKVITVALAIGTPVLFAAWLAVERKFFPSDMSDFVGIMGAHKILSVIVALIMAGTMVFVGAGGIAAIINEREIAERWDYFANRKREYLLQYLDRIEISQGMYLYVDKGPKMIYDNLNALTEKQSAAREALDAYGYLNITNTIDRIMKKLSSAPFDAVLEIEGIGGKEVDYNPNYIFDFARTEEEEAARTVVAVRIISLKNNAATYRLDFADGGYYLGNLAFVTVQTKGNNKAVTWTDKYGFHIAAVN